VGTASAVLYHHGHEWKHTERVFGETVTANDTALRSFIPALDVLTDFMETQPKYNVLIFLPSNFAVNRVLVTSTAIGQGVNNPKFLPLCECTIFHFGYRRRGIREFPSRDSCSDRKSRVKHLLYCSRMRPVITNSARQRFAFSCFSRILSCRVNAELKLYESQADVG
jgi:hypothetical protein